MARPRKGEEKDRPKHIGFRAATWVWDGLQQLAAKQGQPASEVAHDLMEIALGRFGIKPPKKSDTEGRPPAPRTKSPSKSRRARP
jgi:hypothetical protein